MAAGASRDTTYKRLLAVGDIAAAAAAVLLSGIAVGAGRVNLASMLITPLIVVFSKAMGLYDRDELVLRKTTLDEAPQLVQIATLYALLLWLAGGFSDDIPSRTDMLLLWLLLFVLLLASRTVARRLARAVTEEERCLVVGDPVSAAWVDYKLSTSTGTSVTTVGRVSLEDEDPGNPGVTAPPLCGEISGLGLILEEQRIDRVIIAPGASDSEDILDAIRLVKSLGVRVSVLPRLFEVVGSSVEFDDIDGMVLLGVRRYGLSRSSRTLKRAMDILGGTFGLVLLAPMLAMIAIAIKLDSPGPVVFRQRRIGRDDEQFDMFKFRTMELGAEQRKKDLLHRNESKGIFKIANDPRVTRVGMFLRRGSLDELPQLFNVVLGQMSLVGPRPLVVDEDRQVEGWHRRRLLFAPGMTGLWQIFGSARIPLHEMVKIDYLYGATWSVWLDVKVLLRTIPYVLSRRGL